MDITLKTPELAEALRLYLESRGLVVRNDTGVVVRNGEDGELRVEITGVSLGESRPAATAPSRTPPPREEPAEVPLRPHNRPQTAAMVSMPDASEWKPGQLEPTETVSIPVDRFRVEKVPPGEVPNARALGRPVERIVPAYDNDGVAAEYQVHPVEGLLPSSASGPVPGERGSMNDMPNDF
jgi:hypothetical protein